MDKYAVAHVRKMQEDALKEVKDRLSTLRSVHTKTASETQEIERLERQETELKEALAAHTAG